MSNFDWENYTPNVGDKITVNFKNNYNRGSIETAIKPCECTVVYVNREFGEIWLLASEAKFKEKTHHLASTHTWDAFFSIGPYHYRVDDVGIASLDDINIITEQEYVEEDPKNLISLGINYWLQDMDPNDYHPDKNLGKTNAYYVDKNGDIKSTSILERLPSQPFFIFDPEVFMNENVDEDVAITSVPLKPLEVPFIENPTSFSHIDKKVKFEFDEKYIRSRLDRESWIMLEYTYYIYKTSELTDEDLYIILDNSLLEEFKPGYTIDLSEQFIKDHPNILFHKYTDPVLRDGDKFKYSVEFVANQVMNDRWEDKTEMVKCNCSDGLPAFFVGLK